MTDPNAQQKYNAMVTAGVDPATAAAIAFGGSGAQNNDPPAFNGQYTSPPTGYPATQPMYAPRLTGHPGTGAGGQDVQSTVVEPGHGQSPYSGPVTPSSSDMIFQFQEALLKGVPWAVKTRADMVAAGLIPANADPGAVIGAYAQMVKLSAGAVAKGVYKSPQDYIDQWKAIAAHDQNQATTTTQTTTSRTVRNPADLAAAYQQTSTEALGRRASAAEARAGGAAGGRVATPTVSTATTTTRGGKSTSNVVTHEGASDMAINEAMLQHAMQNPEYGAYQAAGRYFPVLEQALQAVTGAGA